MAYGRYMPGMMPDDGRMGLGQPSQQIPAYQVRCGYCASLFFKGTLFAHSCAGRKAAIQSAGAAAATSLYAGAEGNDQLPEEEIALLDYARRVIAQDWGMLPPDVQPVIPPANVNLPVVRDPRDSTFRRLRFARFDPPELEDGRTPANVPPYPSFREEVPPEGGIYRCRYWDDRPYFACRGFVLVHPPRSYGGLPFLLWGLCGNCVQWDIASDLALRRFNMAQLQQHAHGTIPPVPQQWPPNGTVICPSPRCPRGRVPFEPLSAPLKRARLDAVADPSVRAKLDRLYQEDLCGYCWRRAVTIAEGVENYPRADEDVYCEVMVPEDQRKKWRANQANGFCRVHARFDMDEDGWRKWYFILSDLFFISWLDLCTLRCAPSGIGYDDLDPRHQMQLGAPQQIMLNDGTYMDTVAYQALVQQHEAQAALVAQAHAQGVVVEQGHPDAGQVQHHPELEQHGVVHPGQHMEHPVPQLVQRSHHETGEVEEERGDEDDDEDEDADQ